MHLDDALVAKNFFNSDYEGEITDMGSTVKINQIGNVTISDYTRNQDMGPPEELSTVAQELIIDQAKAFNFQISDIDEIQMRADLMDSAMSRAAYNLAATQDEFLFKLISDGVSPDNTEPGIVDITTADQAFSLMVKLRTFLTKSNVPNIGRNLAVPPEFIAKIFHDDRFTGTGGAFAESTLITGLVGRAMGFNIFEVNNMPNNNELLAGHNLGATFASQIAKTEAFRMERRFADGLKGLSVYGAKITVPKAFAKAVVNISS